MVEDLTQLSHVVYRMVREARPLIRNHTAALAAPDPDGRDPQAVPGPYLPVQAVTDDDDRSERVAASFEQQDQRLVFRSWSTRGDHDLGEIRPNPQVVDLTALEIEIPLREQVEGRTAVQLPEQPLDPGGKGQAMGCQTGKGPASGLQSPMGPL